MTKQVVLLVGTKKGLYTLRSDAERRKWTVDGPREAPAPIHHASYDPRDGSMYAAINSTWGGSRIQYSRDLDRRERSEEDAGRHQRRRRLHVDRRGRELGAGQRADRR